MKEQCIAKEEVNWKSQPLTFDGNRCSFVTSLPDCGEACRVLLLKNYLVQVDYLIGLENLRRNSSRYLKFT